MHLTMFNYTKKITIRNLYRTRHAYIEMFQRKPSDQQIESLKFYMKYMRILTEKQLILCLVHVAHNMEYF